MKNINRREFLLTAAAGAGAVVFPSFITKAEVSKQAKTFCGTDLVPLGQTGIKVSRLAQGTGFNGWARQSDHTRLGKDAFSKLLKHSISSGIKFIDMADLYGTHPFVKEVIKDLPRKDLVLLTKIWVRKENWVTPSGGAIEEINRFRSELGVDTIDICLIHCVTDDKWPDTYKRVRDELSELKAKGTIRAVGVSCHDLGALKVAATHSWTDVIFARINYKGGQDYSMDGSAEEVAEVLKIARKNGKAVVGMKIFGAGKLVKPEEKDESLKFVFSNGLVDAITVGMLSPQQVDDTLERMSKTKVA